MKRTEKIADMTIYEVEGFTPKVADIGTSPWLQAMGITKIVSFDCIRFYPASIRKNKKGVEYKARACAAFYPSMEGKELVGAEVLYVKFAYNSNTGCIFPSFKVAEEDGDDVKFVERDLVPWIKDDDKKAVVVKQIKKVCYKWCEMVNPQTESMKFESI